MKHSVPHGKGHRPGSTISAGSAAAASCRACALPLLAAGASALSGCVWKCRMQAICGVSYVNQCCRATCLGQIRYKGPQRLALVLLAIFGVMAGLWLCNETKRGSVSTKLYTPRADAIECLWLQMLAPPGCMCQLQILSVSVGV